MNYDASESRHADVEALVAVASEVFQRIPEGERDQIESKCDVVVFWDGGSQVAAFSDTDRHIRVSVYDLIKFSAPGRRGVLAHEFGHAFDYADSGERIAKKNKGMLERRADDHATRWGFENEVGIRDRERDALWSSVKEN